MSLPWHITLEDDHDDVSCKRYYTTANKHYSHLDLNSPTSKAVLTGIMCDIGPMNKDPENIQKLLEAGMTIAKINEKDLDHDLSVKLIQNIRQAVSDVSVKMRHIYALAIIANIEYHPITTGDMEKHQDVGLIEGCTIKLTNDSSWINCGNKTCIYVHGWEFIESLQKDDIIYLDSKNSTKIKLTVLDATDTCYNCAILIGGHIGNRMPIRVSHVPVEIDNSYVKQQVEWAEAAGVDALLLSTTRTVNDVIELKELLKEHKSDFLIFAGIKTVLAMRNIDRIIENVDGIFFDRRSIATDLPYEKLFRVQKIIGAKCYESGKPFICQAVINDQMPNLCINDIANLVLDGVDVLYLEIEYQLSEKRCVVGINYPIKFAEHSIAAVRVVCKEAESVAWEPFMYGNIDLMRMAMQHPVELVCINTIELAKRTKAVVVICLTSTGKTAKILSRGHSKLPIIVVTRSCKTSRHLRFWKGCKPLHYIAVPKSTYPAEIDAKILSGQYFCRRKGLIKPGDAYVAVYGAKKDGGFCDSVRLLFASPIENYSFRCSDDY